MAVAFDALDKRLSRDINELHNYLWVPGWSGDESKLRANLVKGAAALDGFLCAKGRLRTNAEKLTKPWSRDHQGSALFELLDSALGLAAAAENLRRGRYREAATRATRVIESRSIGVCSTAGCFEAVEEWEAGKIDFEAYTGRLADALDAKGILQAGQFKRILNGVRDFGRDWDATAAKAEQTFAARLAVEGAMWCTLRAVSIHALLGGPMKVPEKDYQSIIGAVASRV